MSKQKGFFAAVVLGTGVAVLALVMVVMMKSGSDEEAVTADSSGDLVIQKSEITETAKFYPYQVNGLEMEVLAVKADDGSVRTAFNTCQVCYSSGRGYYKQEDDELVCQNCGNRFNINEVEQIRGGCNPYPIVQENKTEDANNITIPQGFLTEAKVLFENWKI